jgi:hypothetical protein
MLRELAEDVVYSVKVRANYAIGCSTNKLFCS